MLEQIRQRLRYEGADAVGAAYIKNFLPENLRHLPYGISVEIRLSRAIVAQIEHDRAPSHTYFHNYRTLNAMLDRCTFLAVSLLQSAGYQAIAVPASQTVDRERIAGLISHKLAAAEAGLGRIGRNALLSPRISGPPCVWRRF